MTDLDLRDLQGNILRAYGPEFTHVRYLVLSVVRPDRARAALAAMVDTDRSTPEVTPEAPSPKLEKYSWCLNVAITFRGLQALRLPPSSLETFPYEFREGMVARAARLGDVGSSAPDRWDPGLADADHVHLLVTFHARRTEELDWLTRMVLGAQGGQAFALVTPEPIDGGHMLDERGGHIVHFGFRDGISQPRFAEVKLPDDGPGEPAYTPVGLVLLGHPVAALGMRWRVPHPPPLGHNGTFSAFRVLQQDVAGFESFLRQTADARDCSVEEVAAKMCGRWRNGVPLVVAPTEAEAEAYADRRGPLNAFGYRHNDPDGVMCPVGSHIRRTNPRDANIVPRGTNSYRTVVRRGVPYGIPFDPDDPASAAVPRGLLGNFLCASLAAQFESVQCDWINLGLLDPRITGTNDPLMGANDGKTISFSWSSSDKRQHVVTGLPRFVETKGGAYCFVPSLPALKWIGGARH